MNKATIKAIKQGGGSQSLAKIIGISRQAVEKWPTLGVPPARVIAVEKATGVSRYALRPDIFGRRPPSESRAAG